MPTTRGALRDFIATEWPRVVADAGFGLEAVAYWISEDTPRKIRDRAAMYFLPGRDPDPPFAFSKEQYAEATSPSFYDRHRIIVHLDYDFPEEMSQEATEGFFAAVMRHELEHARQADAPDGRAALEVEQNLVDEVLFRKAGRLTGGAAIYNCKPIEMDANAAAAVYARKHHPSVVDELLGSDVGSFVRSKTGPESLDSLLRRTVCFLFQFRSIADELSEGIPFEERLRLYGGDEAADLWVQLVSSG
jgi:hypothetical protein